MFNPWMQPPPQQQAPPLTPLQHCLYVCGLSANQIVTIEIYERIRTLNQFNIAFTAKKNIDSMVKRLNSGAFQNEPLNQIGQLQIANLYALWDWLYDCRRQGAYVDHTVFNMNTITYYQDEAIRDTTNKPRKESDLRKPPKLTNTTTGWIDWYAKAMNYLRQVPGCVGSTLAYVVREDNKRPLIMDRDLQLLYGMRLEGPNFCIDNVRVFQLLKDWLLESDAWVWIQKHDATQDGRAAMLSLRDHYEGASHMATRTNYYENMLEEEYIVRNQTGRSRILYLK